MKKIEIISAKHSPKRLLTMLIAMAVATVCLFAEMVSFSIATPLQVKASSLSEDASSDTLYCHRLAYELIVWKINDRDATSLHELVDGYFCENATNSNVMSYVQALIDEPYLSPDFTSYTSALADTLNNEVTSEKEIYPTTLQQSIITLIKCQAHINSSTNGTTDITTGNSAESSTFSLSDLVSEAVLQEAFNNTIGSKGIMSYIFGLNMLETCNEYNVEYACDFTREEIILELLSLQLSDGGYALTGNEGDIDVTAMALAALAPSYTNIDSYNFTLSQKTNLAKAVEASISFLANSQLDTGDYASYNSACSESTSQVILAVCALIAHNDYNDIYSESFTKKNNSLLDGLLLYRLSDGSFTHTNTPAVTNDMASAQAFQALCAFSSIQSIVEASAAVTLEAPTASASLPSKISNRARVKIIWAIIIGAFSIICCIIITITAFKNLTKKAIRKSLPMKIASILVLTILAEIVIFTLDIQSKDSFENTPSSTLKLSETPGLISITFGIDSSSAMKFPDSEIFELQPIYVKENSTVFEVLEEVCRVNNIQLDYEGDSVYGGAYIKGIRSLYEKDFGDLSGWMYRVNGEFPSVGCSNYIVQENDCIEWLYTKDLGRDLE